MNAHGPLWRWLSWAFVLGALVAVICWIITREWALLALTVLLGIAACVVLWRATGDLADDIGADPHPLDPYPEELRRQARQRQRLAMGRLRERSPARDDEIEERGL